MADDTTTPTPAAPDYTDPAQQSALYNQLLQQAFGSQGTQPQEPAHSGDNRTWGSLLGQALVGGAGPGSTDTANEQAGLRGLMSVGLGMMSGSDYSRAKHSLGSIVADAIGGAQQGNYEQQTAMLAYQKQQQEMQLERIKTALPLLTQLQQLQLQKTVRGLPSSLGATTAPGANTSIAAVGAVPGGTLLPGEAPINAAGDSATRKAGEGGPPAPGTPGAAVAQQVHDFWIGKGYSEAQVAGIMAGGPGSESNFDPTVFGDKGTSHGLYQLHGPRLDAERQYFGLTGNQMPTADQQNQYAAFELSPQGPKAAVGAALLKAQTPAEAAAIYTRSYGVPGDKTEIGRRAAGAGRFMGLYGQPQPPGAPGAPVTAQTPPAGSTGAQALPLPPIPPAQPPGVSGTPLPAGRPTGPPIITDQPAGGATVAGPPGTAIVGQPLPPSPAVPGNVNAIIGGMTGAGANATTLAPGPGSAAPAAPLATQAQVQPQPPPITTPPPPAPTLAEGPPTFTYKPNVELTPAEQQTLRQAQQSYENSIRIAITPDERQKAEATLQTTLSKQAEILAARRAEDFKQQQADHDKAVDTFYKNKDQQQQLENQLRIETAKGEQSRLTNKEAVFNQANQKGLETEASEQANAHGVVQQLEGFSSISDAVGQPGWMQTTKMPGTDQTIAERLQQAGIKMDDTAGVQLLRGGITNLVKTLRAGMPMGSLSDRDLNFIERMGPTEWMDQDTRSAAVGYLKQAYRSQEQFHRDVQREMARGKNYADAFDDVSAKQRPFVAQVPADLTAHWGDNTGNWPQQRADWAERNDVRPGTLIHMDNGKIVVVRRPRAAEQR